MPRNPPTLCSACAVRVARHAQCETATRLLRTAQTTHTMRHPHRTQLSFLLGPPRNGTGFPHWLPWGWDVTDSGQGDSCGGDAHGSQAWHRDVPHGTLGSSLLKLDPASWVVNGGTTRRKEPGSWITLCSWMTAGAKHHFPPPRHHESGGDSEWHTLTVISHWDLGLFMTADNLLNTEIWRNSRNCYVGSEY